MAMSVSGSSVNSPAAIGLNGNASGLAISTPMGRMRIPTGTSASDCTKVCGCHSPNCAPPLTNGTQAGANTRLSPAPSTVTTISPAGNPANHLSIR